MSARDDIMKDYVPVNERIAAFLAKHPDGSLQSELVELSDNRVVMRAYAYRTPDDPRPGIGYSSLEIPGRTPYTRGSEIENAETSSWGRAIAALGFEVKRGIASQEEVDNKRDADRAAPPRLPARTDPATAEPHPTNEPYSETEELIGRVKRRGTIRKGTSEHYKLEGRIGSDGYVIGFRLEVGPEKHIPQCVVSGALGESLWIATKEHPDKLAGTSATVSGILYYVKSSRGTTWYRLHVDRFENDDYILPADPADGPVPEPVEAPSVPLFDDAEQTRIDAALDKVAV